MSTPNPDEAMGMADEPEQARGTGARTGDTTAGGPGENAEGTTARTEEGGAPNPETGVGLGAGEPNTFEPEEDPDA